LAFFWNILSDSPSVWSPLAAEIAANVIASQSSLATHLAFVRQLCDIQAAARPGPPEAIAGATAGAAPARRIRPGAGVSPVPFTIR
jgi:hypothetical protein